MLYDLWKIYFLQINMGSESDLLNSIATRVRYLNNNELLSDIKLSEVKYLIEWVEWLRMFTVSGINRLCRNIGSSVQAGPSLPITFGQKWRIMHDFNQTATFWIILSVLEIFLFDFWRTFWHTIKYFIIFCIIDFLYFMSKQ